MRIRSATADDVANVVELARSLSRESIVRRFLGGVSRETATRELVREVSNDGCDVALIAENERGEILGEAYAAIVSPRTAEAAFVVRDGDQHHGVGTALFAALVAALRVRGITTLHADTAATNVAMLALFHDGDRPVRTHRVDGTVRITMELGVKP